MGYTQNYESYFTGNTTDTVTSPQGGICLMGGATEDDEAIKWFLNRANGGDVVVLRASGSDGYNDYFYNQLGVSINSVETIVFNNQFASNESYIEQRILQAEAIWIAGGDQWNYISYWSNTAIEDALNQRVIDNAVIGGTSAGMAILGSSYFSAENGTLTSSAALTNPYGPNVTPVSLPFLTVPYLENTITDTHYDNPDRKARHVVLMGRIFVDDSINSKGIACDEYTAVCVDENGIASVYGQYPNYDDRAYFLQMNCQFNNPGPEVMVSGTAVTWNRDNEAIKVYEVTGTPNGANTFDLNDWKTGSGGDWQHWSIQAGVFNEEPGTAPNCNLSVDQNSKEIELTLSPNPASENVQIQVSKEQKYSINVLSIDGKLMATQAENFGETTYEISQLVAGVYVIRIGFEDGTFVNRRISVIR